MQGRSAYFEEMPAARARTLLLTAQRTEQKEKSIYFLVPPRGKMVVLLKDGADPLKAVHENCWYEHQTPFIEAACKALTAQREGNCFSGREFESPQYLDTFLEENPILREGAWRLFTTASPATLLRQYGFSPRWLDQSLDLNEEIDTLIASAR